MFDEVFLPHMAEAYRLAQWLTGNAYDAEDVVQDAALRAFRGIKSFGAVNARAWSLTIVRKIQGGRLHGRSQSCGAAGT